MVGRRSALVARSQGNVQNLKGAGLRARVTAVSTGAQVSQASCSACRASSANSAPLADVAGSQNQEGVGAHSVRRLPAGWHAPADRRSHRVQVVGLRGDRYVGARAVVAGGPAVEQRAPVPAQRDRIWGLARAAPHPLRAVQGMQALRGLVWPVVQRVTCNSSARSRTVLSTASSCRRAGVPTRPALPQVTGQVVQRW